MAGVRPLLEAERAAARLLEAAPRERVRTHWRQEPPRDDRVKDALARSRMKRGVKMEIGEMVKRYAELKNKGLRFVDIRNDLHVAARTMARLRDKAMQLGLLKQQGGEVCMRGRRPSRSR